MCRKFEIFKTLLLFSLFNKYYNKCYNEFYPALTVQMMRANDLSWGQVEGNFFICIFYVVYFMGLKILPNVYVRTRLCHQFRCMPNFDQS